MQDVTTWLGQATTAFGAVAALAILVWGFFKGRKWLAMGMDDEMTDEDRNFNRYWKEKEEYERAERETNEHNNMHGTGPGWHHDGRGSGLHRGKR